jgi:hypothetical protein
MLKYLKEVRTGIVSYADNLLIADVLASNLTYIDYRENVAAKDELIKFITDKLSAEGYRCHFVDLFSSVDVGRIISVDKDLPNSFFIILTREVNKAFVDNIEAVLKANIKLIVERVNYGIADTIKDYIRFCHLRELEFTPGHIENRTPTQWTVSYPLQTAIRFTT